MAFIYSETIGIGKGFRGLLAGLGLFVLGRCPADMSGATLLTGIIDVSGGEINPVKTGRFQWVGYRYMLMILWYLTCGFILAVPKAVMRL